MHSHRQDDAQQDRHVLQPAQRPAQHDQCDGEQKGQEAAKELQPHRPQRIVIADVTEQKRADRALQQRVIQAWDKHVTRRDGIAEACQPG
jgi:hypothetical protein